MMDHYDAAIDGIGRNRISDMRDKISGGMGTCFLGTNINASRVGTYGMKDVI